MANKMRRFTATCSRCGRRSKEIFYDMSAAVGLARGGWRSFGTALYCPECAKKWENGHGEEMSGMYVAALVIMDWMIGDLKFEIKHLEENENGTN